MRLDRAYRAMVSSDWSECLSPNGPFDPLAFTYPQLDTALSSIFRSYTGNEITLRSATQRIQQLLPEPFTREQMDAYLDNSFRTYTNVPDLIEWCLSNDVLFMINTTGTQAYFQRALEKNLLPGVQVVAANPMIAFHSPDLETSFDYQVLETEDKARNSQAVLDRLDMPPAKLLVMGDSGGDGPHFRWGGRIGAHLAGSMTKFSLQAFCDSAGVTIGRHFGITYGKGEARDLEREMSFDFMELTDLIREIMDSSGQ